ncbi:hypothetical protein SeMB42_g01941 [Synchytrium endobioticum]|uniref:Uncharacterized protein n=1 Tax=Synchytrium endobioticum TaxID=286115 RepID=A0A507DIC4_9FUNG|nr:hypothetical protein SeMB42_g01941 [Synchytrium endobioticum]
MTGSHKSVTVVLPPHTAWLWLMPKSQWRPPTHETLLLENAHLTLLRRPILASEVPSSTIVDHHVLTSLNQGNPKEQSAVLDRNPDRDIKVAIRGTNRCYN